MKKITLILLIIVNANNGIIKKTYTSIKNLFNKNINKVPFENLPLSPNLNKEIYNPINSSKNQPITQNILQKKLLIPEKKNFLHFNNFTLNKNFILNKDKEFSSNISLNNESKKEIIKKNLKINELLIKDIIKLEKEIEKTGKDKKKKSRLIIKFLLLVGIIYFIDAKINQILSEEEDKKEISEKKRFYSEELADEDLSKFEEEDRKEILEKKRIYNENIKKNKPLIKSLYEKIKSLNLQIDKAERSEEDSDKIKEIIEKKNNIIKKIIEFRIEEIHKKENYFDLIEIAEFRIKNTERIEKNLSYNAELLDYSINKFNSKSALLTQKYFSYKVLNQLIKKIEFEVKDFISKELLSKKSLEVIKPILHNHLEKNITNLDTEELFNYDKIIKEVEKTEKLINSEINIISQITKNILDKKLFNTGIHESGHMIISDMAEKSKKIFLGNMNNMRNGGSTISKIFPLNEISDEIEISLAGFINEELFEKKPAMSFNQFKDFIERENTDKTIEGTLSTREGSSNDINYAISLIPKNSNKIEILYKKYKETRILLEPHFNISKILALNFLGGFKEGLSNENIRVLTRDEIYDILHSAHFLTQLEYLKKFGIDLDEINKK